jgi:ketosteroid isomerase-like protein
MRLSEQGNVTLVRRAFGLVGNGDIAGLAEIIGPGFELHENVLAPDAGVYHGKEGLKKWLDASLEAFVDFRFEPERFIEGAIGSSPRSMLTVEAKEAERPSPRGT